MHTLIPSMVTSELFAPFGDVIQCDPDRKISINAARFDRYSNLANIDVAEQNGYPNVSIFSCQVPSTLPLEIALLERHPLGSQAFYPLSEFAFFVVVAPPGDTVRPEDLRAFVTNGSQGLNLNRGVWHLPLIGLEAHQQFVVFDRGGPGNYDEFILPETVILSAPKDND